MKFVCAEAVRAKVLTASAILIKNEGREFSMNITKGTILRTVFLGVTLALTDVFFIAMLVVLLKLGFIETAGAAGYATTLVAANIRAATAWWKNNSFTQKALEGDAVIAAMKEYDEQGASEDENIDDPRDDEQVEH